MAKIVNDTELIFDESDIREDGSLDIAVFENDNVKKEDITRVVLPDDLETIPKDAFFT